jgi:hypothetical protein
LREVAAKVGNEHEMNQKRLFSDGNIDRTSPTASKYPRLTRQRKQAKRVSILTARISQFEKGERRIENEFRVLKSGPNALGRTTCALQLSSISPGMTCVAITQNY